MKVKRRIKSNIKVKPEKKGSFEVARASLQLTLFLVVDNSLDAPIRWDGEFRGTACSAAATSSGGQAVWLDTANIVSGAYRSRYLKHFRVGEGLYHGIRFDLQIHLVLNCKIQISIVEMFFFCFAYQ